MPEIWISNISADAIDGGPAVRRAANDAAGIGVASLSPADPAVRASGEAIDERSGRDGVEVRDERAARRAIVMAVVSRGRDVEG